MSKVLSEVESVTVIVRFKDGYESPAARMFTEDKGRRLYGGSIGEVLLQAYNRCMELARRED